MISSSSPSPCWPPIPVGRTRRDVSIVRSARWHEVPGAGVEVLRAGTGGNPHTLVADPGTCRWTTGVDDPQRLALGALRTTGVAYLIHPEHGGSGIAPAPTSSAASASAAA